MKVVSIYHNDAKKIRKSGENCLLFFAVVVVVVVFSYRHREWEKG